jgi:hypothetical protein
LRVYLRDYTVIDSTLERVFGFAVAAKEIDRLRSGMTIDQEFAGIDRRKTNISTIYRWSTVGCRGVVLETIQVGGTRCTSREALQRFFVRLSAAQCGDVEPVAARSSSERLRESEKAGKALELAGV